MERVRRHDPIAKWEFVIFRAESPALSCVAAPFALGISGMGSTRQSLLHPGPTGPHCRFFLEKTLNNSVRYQWLPK
jgi:hypothetical protein